MNPLFNWTMAERIITQILTTYVEERAARASRAAFDAALNAVPDVEPAKRDRL